ncbi:hypothetical protein [Cupriavidus sp. a3]|uniref:hypothetical protein n=1 Tax=Cupriavidus sp. a3 TaxID=3242158 RepID=UPI003D9C5DAC
MKSLLYTFVGAVALAFSLSAVAGPDWYVIEKARAAKQTEAQQKSQQSRDHAAMMGMCREMMGQPK